MLLRAEEERMREACQRRLRIAEKGRERAKTRRDPTDGVGQSSRQKKTQAKGGGRRRKGGRVTSDICSSDYKLFKRKGSLSLLR